MAERVRMVQMTPRSERDVLKTKPKKGFTRRLVINDPIRIEEMQDLGYKVVTKADGGPQTHREYVLMEIPEDLYREREAAKVEDTLAEREKMLNRAARSELESKSRSGEFRGKSQIIGSVELETP